MVNLTLWSLILLGLGIMVWHVWVFGPEEGGRQVLGTKPFILILLNEVWHMITGSHGIMAEIGDVWIYFMIGILIAGYIRTYKLHIRLRKTLNRHGFVSIFIAAIIGVFSPLCSCGILATVIGLLSAGLPLAPAMALLIASPLMSPTAFLLTIGDLGAEWAVIRTVTAFLMGVLAGVVTHLLHNRGFQTDTLFLDTSVLEGDFHDHDFADERLRCTCREKFSNRIARRVKNNFVIFWAKTLEMTWMIGKYVLVGIAVGAIAEEYIPPTWLNQLFGQQSKLGIVWVTLGSIPVFLHQISASSILYHIKEALPGTLDKGAGLAFLIGGPVTAIPAMTLLWAMFKKRVFVLYMGISILGTILLAYSFDAFVFVPHTDAGNPVLSGVGVITGGPSSIIKKSNKYIHIAVDPDKKPVIAIYHDFFGGSGIAFDSCIERFSNKSASVQDNAAYIKNIANWLDTTSQTEITGRILIYNTFSQTGYDNSYFEPYLPKLLTKNKYQVKITDRRQTPRLIPEMLSGYNQLWLISGEARSTTFSPEELEAVTDFRDEGGSLLIVAGPQKSKHEDFTRDANQIAKNFGVEFSGVINTAEVIPISIYGKFFNTAALKLKSYYDIVRKLRE
jgi:hypothetical protein